MLLDTVLLPSPVSTHASYTLRHRSKLRNCLTIYLMLRCTHSSTPVPLVPKILELFVAKFIFIQITFMFRFETLSITPRLAFISYFPFLYTYIVHVAPGSLLFTRASFLFFSSSLCFAAIIGHRSLFYGMDFRFGMVSHSGCFYSHFATPCLVSSPMISGRCMVL